MANPVPTSGYAPVNGLQMYYEIHGTGQPLVLMHGAFSAIGTSFDKLLPELTKSRQVIGLEMQAHGRTADIDRPLSIEQMADDTAAGDDSCLPRRSHARGQVIRTARIFSQSCSLEQKCFREHRLRVNRCRRC